LISLNSIGWNSYFYNQFNEYKESGLIPGRITVEHKERYHVLTEYGELNAEVSGRLLYASENPSDFPKTGDWVAGLYFQDEQKLIIQAVLERQTIFSRNAAGKKNFEQVIAANIDCLFILQSMDNDFSIRRLERYISTALEGKIKPVIVLTKTDKCSQPDLIIKRAKEAAGEIPVIGISSVNNTGLDSLNEYLKEGTTGALVGSSGVGKSTLVNALIGEDVQKTLEVREYDSKGRHTTTRREMFILPGGGIIIDTPGMREFQLWSSGDGIEMAFDEIGELAKQCKFSDCTHTLEKGCAVLEAVKNGELPEDRYRSYIKLQKEISYLDKKDDIDFQLEEKRKWKNIHREIRRYYKTIDKRKD
jgi:ribosome biogenesis GTPase